MSNDLKQIPVPTKEHSADEQDIVAALERKIDAALQVRRLEPYTLNLKKFPLVLSQLIRLEWFNPPGSSLSDNQLKRVNLPSNHALFAKIDPKLLPGQPVGSARMPGQPKIELSTSLPIKEYPQLPISNNPSREQPVLSEHSSGKPFLNSTIRQRSDSVCPQCPPSVRPQRPLLMNKPSAPPHSLSGGEHKSRLPIARHTLCLPPPAEDDPEQL